MKSVSHISSAERPTDTVNKEARASSLERPPPRHLLSGQNWANEASRRGVPGKHQNLVLLPPVCSQRLKDVELLLLHVRSLVASLELNEFMKLVLEAERKESQQRTESQQRGQSPSREDRHRTRQQAKDMSSHEDAL
ncbi:unnamed protein product [Pleuronectes platessa]|uniref:Uncharacterized protein n=1 Tax=Pleuronectes platessa TaxID=8262 RepID=A0A9N7TKR2_PLEPL|nr:unnamed protein product [Pleuronectes platessa]